MHSTSHSHEFELASIYRGPAVHLPLCIQTDAAGVAGREGGIAVIGTQGGLSEELTLETRRR